MNLKIAFSSFTTLILCAQISCAQQYLFTRYTPKDGLVNNRARFMYQDSKGRLYISTFGGLSVYDGSRFTNYTTENGLATSLINDVVEMGDDSLWIIPNGAAVHCMVHGVIHNIRMSDEDYPVVNQLLHSSDGHYYAIADQGLFRLDKQQFVKIPLRARNGRDAGQYLVHAVEWNGLLVILTDANLGEYQGRSSVLLYNPANGKVIVPETPVGVNYIAKSPDGDILATTSKGVRRLDLIALRRDSIRFVPLRAPYQATNAMPSGYIFFDHSQNLWLSTTKGIVKIDPQGRQRAFNKDNGLPAGNNNVIFEDRENNIWFINDQNGIIKLARQAVELYSNPQEGFTVTDLCADARSDSAWFYDGNSHTLMLISGNGRKLFHAIGEMPPPGHIVIGNYGGVLQGYIYYDYKLFSLTWLTDKNQFRAVQVHQALPDVKRDNPNPYFYATFDQEGSLMLVSDSLSVLLPGRPDRILPQQSIEYMADQEAVDRSNRIWIATRANKLFVFGRKPNDPSLQLLHTWSEEVPWRSARSIAVDRKGHVWVGTRDNGLYCLSFDKLHLISALHLTIKNGLSENFVNFLQCDPDNTLWACTPSGLDRIRLDDSSATGFTIDNITSSNAAYQSTFKIVTTASGVHWALANGGIIRIGPAREGPTTYLPSVLFSRILAGNEPVTGTGQQVTLPYDRNSISVYVGASSFVDETLTRYSYLLDGSSDARWTDPSSESSIHLIDLPPGKYTLRVKAQFLTGHYREQEGDYTFIILPPWWQTWWFRALTICALAGLGILWTRGYVRRRLAKQRIALEKRQAIEKERTRIATDMHDDLGAGLSRIKFLSETIGIRQQQQQSIEEEITGIRQYSNEMIDKMGEIVWALNEKNDSLSDLLSYTRSYAVEYLMQAGLSCEAAPPDTVPSLHVNGEFRRNVYLTVKEALHNIVKHARADKVVIRMEAGKELVIAISDDGIGFDKSRVRPFSNGLANMQKRIREIGGELIILHGDSSKMPKNNGQPDQDRRPGTTVRLTVPLPTPV